MAYNLLKFLHVLGATVILGTGTGIAFFMLMAHLSRDAAYIARTAGTVVIADALLTRALGVPLTEPWVVLSLALYGLAGLFWLPVIWMQARMRDLARDAAKAGAALPTDYHRLFRLWFAFGFPGFGSVMAIVWLMIAKPALSFP